MDTRQALRDVYLFSALDDGQLDQMIKSMRRVELNGGERLFELGQPARQFFLVRKGQIKLFRLSPGGDEKVIEIIGPGKTFAEAVMFMEGHNYPVSADAIGPTELFAFDNNTFLALLRESTDTCFRVMADMSHRLHRRINEIDQLTLQNASYRLVNYLLQKLPDGPGPAKELTLEAPKNVIASHLSIQPETFSRILHQLSDQGLIDVHGKTIRVHDVQRLREL